ncbi:ral guanine nucleotide dissociation stimulator-like 1 isoform X2 [Periophthalmus magnuspinnatus]|uniref:ral guanine nucleotide dissociation stimulator-like 1 isoform X2 n=1 Tax=Periophthalmus magnuspinnatus TaxID=409849 RepID=UPI002436FB83|nr:ral guanine nucleotide dissociation stimulator-like 1 isoform X2 [Periophthalmus magnuspinnatus]
MGKWELTMNPVQEWGEEVEDGAVYGVTLRREPVPSSAPCTAFVQYRTCKVRRLKAATLNQLVNHLLDPKNQDQDYGQILLSTYRTFTCTSTLIERLFLRDSAVTDLDNTNCYNRPLLTFVQAWLDDYSEDFRDPPCHAALRLLLDHLTISSAVHSHMRMQPNFCSLAGQAADLLKSFQKEDAESNLSTTQELSQAEYCPADDDSGCENSLDLADVMDFATVAIAEQLTRLDAALFVKVVPYECLGSVWSQRDKENLSPTIRATVAQFNAVTNQVILSLLCPFVDASSSPTCSDRPSSTPAQRARIIEKWIRVAQECRRLKNFSSLKAILSALQSNAVYRLRKSWAAVNRDSMATFENLCETFPDENCVLSKGELLEVSTSSGVVPYLGTYLTVLTMWDTALPDTVEGGLINFEKRRREFEVLSQIQQLQASCSLYNLHQHPQITAWLQGRNLLSDQESYELSRQLEPPVDLSSPTAWSHRSITKKLSFLRSMSEGSKKLPPDQISVSSSGSSGSEMEDLSSPNSIPLQTFSSSCSRESVFSTEVSSHSPSPSSSSSSDTHLDSLCSPPASECGGARPKDGMGSHKRSVSMTSLPVYNRQVADSCIIRISVDSGHNNGNMYKSILLTSQDKTAQVVQRALEKHNLEHMNFADFTLTQVISSERELLIPDKANVFYAMSTTANFDFVLRKYEQDQKKPLSSTQSLGRYTK